MKNFKNYNKVSYSLYFIILFVVLNFGCKSTWKEPPRINATGLGCEDEYCIWIKGDHFGDNTVVEIRKSDSGGQPIAKYTELEKGMNGPDQVITFAVKEQEVKDAMNSPTGVIVKVTNLDNNFSVDTQPIVRQAKK